MKEKSSTPLKTVFIIAVLVIVALFLESGSIKVAQDGGIYKISAGLAGSEKIDISDITAVELRETFEPGTRTFGFGGFKLSGGTFSNAEFGSYKLYMYKSVKAVVIISLGNGRVVFNQPTYEETTAAYEALKKATGM